MKRGGKQATNYVVHLVSNGQLLCNTKGAAEMRWDIGIHPLPSEEECCKRCWKKVSK